MKNSPIAMAILSSCVCVCKCVTLLSGSYNSGENNHPCRFKHLKANIGDNTIIFGNVLGNSRLLSVVLNFVIEISRLF